MGELFDATELMPLAYAGRIVYIPYIVTTFTQDPEDRFNALVAEMRADCGVHVPVGPVALLIEQLFIYLLRLMAGFAGRVRGGEVPVVVPVNAPEQPCVPLPEVLARQSGLPEERSPEDASGGSVIEQPQMQEPIAEAPRVGRSLPPACGKSEVALPAGVALPRRARVGKLDELCGAVMFLCTVNWGFLGVGLKIWGF